MQLQPTEAAFAQVRQEVLAHLIEQPDTPAKVIAKTLSMLEVEVYQALVELESRGIASMRSRQHRGGTSRYVWAATSSRLHPRAAS